VTDRIDRYLEGTITRDELTPDEREEAAVIEGAIESAREMARRGREPDLARAVMRRVRERPAPARVIGGALWERVWAAREFSFRLRPLYGALAVVALLGAAMLLGRATLPSRGAAGSGTPPILLVQFRIQLDEAMSVRLAGSFTEWQPEYELHQSAPGVWTVTVPLGAGVHDYAFVVDGTRWVADPLAPAVDDGFGGRNSRIALLPPVGPRS
jgi:hypothetical protein